MKCWWYDYSAINNRPQLKGFSDLMSLFINRDCDIPNRILKKKPTDLNIDDVTNIICFIHADTIPGLTKEDWKRIASVEHRRYVIFVSSHPKDLKTHVDAEQGINAITHDLSKVASALDENKIKYFLESCAKGKLDSSLFELTLPEWVLAAYLIGIAKDNDVVIDENALRQCSKDGENDVEFWDCVKAEFNRFSISYRMQSVDDYPNQEQLKSLLGVIADKVA